MKKYVIALFLLAACVGGWFLWTGGGGKGKVEILASEEVERGVVRKVLEETGIVKSQVGAIVKIGARATGTIEKMLVKVGDPVTAGQLVARIDRRELDAQASEVRARLATAEAEVERIERIFPLRIKEAEAELALAEAQEEYRKENYERKRKLVEQRVISRDELEDVRQQALVATGRVRARAAILKRIEREFAEERRKAALAVEQARAALASIEIRISYTSIRSPLEGVVSQVSAQEGEMIVTGLQVANLITVLDTRRLEMWIYIDETDVGQVRRSQQVEFRVDAYPDRTFLGEIAAIYPEPEIRDNIVYYRGLVAIDEEQARSLRPEMTTQVQIVVEEKKDVLRLPNSALKWVRGEQVVFAEDEGEVRRVVPELGLSGLTYSEILRGLKEGEKVATAVKLPPRKGK